MNPIAQSLERYMDLVSARQKLVSSNIANAATPGYKTKDIDFQFEFQSSILDSGVDAVEVPGLKAGNDGNNVSLDRESRLLAENAIRFNLASAAWKTQLRLTRSAIQEGRNG